jgi:NADPH-dependent 2,4-dienoyl-CoA reductase/sulfur reductase-like enzyme
MPRLLGNIDAEIASLAARELERHGVEVLTGAPVTGFEGPGRLERVRTGAGDLDADLALLALGVRPNAALAHGFGVDLTPMGAIAVNERLETNLPGVYAAGDCVEVHHLVSGRHAYVPLGDTANRQGRVAGENAGGGDARFAGVVGTAVFRVFDLGVATTGLSEFEAAALGLDASAVTVVVDDRAPYLTDRRPLTVKLMFETRSGRLLGAELAGRPEAVKRVDTISALLHRRGTIEDLAALDLGYSPTYGPVLDPVIVAANRAIGARRASFRPERVPVGVPTR